MSYSKERNVFSYSHFDGDRGYLKIALMKFAYLDARVNLKQSVSDFPIVDFISEMRDEKPFELQGYQGGADNIHLLSDLQRFGYRRPVWELVDSVLMKHCSNSFCTTRQERFTFFKGLLELYERHIKIQEAFTRFRNDLMHIGFDVDEGDYSTPITVIMDRELTGACAHQQLSCVLSDLASSLEAQFIKQKK